MTTIQYKKDQFFCTILDLSKMRLETKQKCTKPVEKSKLTNLYILLSKFFWLVVVRLSDLKRM